MGRGYILKKNKDDRAKGQLNSMVKIKNQHVYGRIEPPNPSLVHAQGRLKAFANWGRAQGLTLDGAPLRSRLCLNKIMIGIILMAKYCSHTYPPKKREFQTACQLAKVDDHIGHYTRSQQNLTVNALEGIHVVKSGLLATTPWTLNKEVGLCLQPDKYQPG
ncbi:hypothetical protein TNCV_2537031 [Trichonephila clavipes]|nr:hypothetical protein TNCV_2537031 [Trichonephila clavipes]